MNSLYWSHTLRIARPLGLLSRTRTQIRLAELSQVPPRHYGQRPAVRSFSIMPAAVAIVDTSITTIINIHAATHIPWFVLIPLLSIGAHAVFRLPFLLYTQSINRHQAKSFLVMRGWGWRIPQAIHKERIPKDQIEKEEKKRMSMTVSRINRALGTQKWKMWSSVLGFPGWIICLECMREICGGPRGLFGSLIVGDTNNHATGHEATISTDIASAATSQGSTVNPSISVATTEYAQADLLDPSIMFEGCLWFTDLSVPDPYHILPVALSAMLVKNLLPKGGIPELLGRNKSKDASTIVGAPSPWQLRLRRAAVAIALFIGPGTADMPAALHFYWLTSATMSYVINKALSRYNPIKLRKVDRCNGVEPNIIQPKRFGKDGPYTRKNTAQTDSKP
ncbi:uncharacterized protein GGS22DRAFT_47694 [Annulohypoxylon maeteangense]|uniref:uncharacterized protein n=1 Tax=Annulohypoxylon maeteangense TaxID=1927788 RepID=UPI002008B334|nr:uncharacterized protein GGS22DRAFT_47694 [Annulohypoxylon maeteangense]KAI0882669.1 hypothetical protein GGS22DRAFT_47694 [Annulohypoxylon maeteangense]